MSMVDSDARATYLEKVHKKGVLPKMVPQDAEVYNLLKRDTEAVVVGKKPYRAPIWVRTGGFFRAANFDGSTSLGPGNAGKREEYTASPYEFTLAKELSLEVEYHTNDKQKAIENVVESEMEDASKGMATCLDILAMQSGNGILGAVTAGNATTSVTVDDARLFYPGMAVTSYTANQATQRATAGGATDVEIVEVDVHNNVLTLSVAFASQIVGDVMCLGGLSGATPVTVGGIPYWHNGATTGLVGGLDRATYKSIRTPNIAAGSQLTPSHGYQLITRMRRQRGKDSVKKGFWLGSMTTWAGVAESVTQVQEIDGPADGGTVPDTGFDVESEGRFCGRKFHQCSHYPDTRLEYFVPSSWGKLIVEDVGFLKIGKNILFPRYSTTDGYPMSSYVFYLRWEGAYMCFDTSTGGYISSLVKPAGY